MAVTQFRSKRKITGGRYKPFAKKLKSKGNSPVLTVLGEKTIKSDRTRAGNQKLKLLSNNIANVYDPKTKKFEKLKIITITENLANRNFIRRNIMTKGALIKTEKGVPSFQSEPLG
jgi:small subunit ribosomal protein S8e